MGRTPRSAVMCMSLISAFVLYLTAVYISMDSAVTQVTCSHPTSACAGGSSTSNADLSSPLSGSGLTPMTSCITPLTSSNVAPAVVSSQAHRGVGALSRTAPTSARDHRWLRIRPARRITHSRSRLHHRTREVSHPRLNVKSSCMHVVHSRCM